MALPSASQVATLPVFAGRQTVDPYPNMLQSASNFVPHSQRYSHFTVEIDMGNTMTLPLRLEAAIHVALVNRMAEAADRVLRDAKMRLQPGHGYDTGLMYESLVKSLVDHFEQGEVAYVLAAPAAPYWVYVEFGHMTRGGNWWAGYHFLTGALMDNEQYIVNKANQAIRDAISALAVAEAAGAAVRG